MANRYWVGGTNTWNGTATGKWSTTSGGAAGAAVPTAADDVFFDANSGASSVVTLGVAGVCRSINFTGFTGTFAGSSGLTVGTSTSGNCVFVATMTLTWTGTLTLAGTASGNVFYSGGLANFRPITVNGAGCSWSLGDALTMVSTGTFTLTQGTFSTANFNMTVGLFNSSGSTARTLNLGSSTITTINNGPVPFNFTTVTNLTFNAGTSTCSMTTGVQFNGGTLTFYNVTLSGSSNKTTAGAFTVSNNFTIATSGTVGINGAIQVNNVDASAMTSTLTASASIGVSGNFTLGASMAWSGTGSGTITFNSTATGKTITMASKQLRAIVFNGVGGGWALQDAITLQAGYDLTLTAGTLDTNNQSVTARSVVFSGSGTKVLTLGSSTLECQRGSAGAFYAWDASAATNLTLNAGTSTILLSGSDPWFSGGAFTYYNVSLTGTLAGPSIIVLIGGAITNTLTLPGTGAVGTGALLNLDTSSIGTLAATSGATVIVQDNSTFDVDVMSVDGTSGNLTSFEALTPGTPWYITSSSPSITCDYIELTDSQASGTTFNAGAHSNDNGNNSGWTFGGGGTTYNEPLTETAAANDNETAAATFGSSLSETTSSGDARGSAVIFPASLTESAAATETELAGNVITVARSESVAATETEASAQVMGASRAESATAAETTGSTYTTSVTLSESGTAGDGVSSGSVFNEPLTESATAAEARNAVATFVSTRSESGAAGESATGDVISGGTVYNVSLIETAKATDFADPGPEQSRGSDYSGYLHAIRRKEPERDWLAEEREDAERIEQERQEAERQEALRLEAVRLQRELAEARRRIELARLTADLEVRQAAVKAEQDRQAQARQELAAVQAERNRIALLNRHRREEEDAFFMLLAA